MSQLNHRIPVSKATRDRLLDLCRGLNLNYDDTINWLINQVVKPGDDPIIVGRHLREEVRKTELGTDHEA